MDALQHCSTLVVQPAELFPLFPDETRPWAGAADRTPSRPRWGLHPPLADLRSIVRQRLAADAAAEPLENGAGEDVERQLAAAARQCVAEYLLEVPLTSLEFHIRAWKKASLAGSTAPSESSPASISGWSGAAAVDGPSSSASALILCCLLSPVLSKRCRAEVRTCDMGRCGSGRAWTSWMG